MRVYVKEYFWAPLFILLLGLPAQAESKSSPKGGAQPAAITSGLVQLVADSDRDRWDRYRGHGNRWAGRDWDDDRWKHRDRDRDWNRYRYDRRYYPRHQYRYDPYYRYDQYRPYGRYNYRYDPYRYNYGYPNNYYYSPNGGFGGILGGLLRLW